MKRGYRAPCSLPSFHCPHFVSVHGHVRELAPRPLPSEPQEKMCSVLFPRAMISSQEGYTSVVILSLKTEWRCLLVQLHPTLAETSLSPTARERLACSAMSQPCFQLSVSCIFKAYTNGFFYSTLVLQQLGFCILLVHSSCSNRIPQAGQLTNSRRSFLTFLEQRSRHQPWLCSTSFLIRSQHVLSVPTDGGRSEGAQRGLL